MAKSPKFFYSHSTLPSWTSRLRRVSSSSSNFCLCFLIMGLAGILFGSIVLLREFISGPKCFAADPISMSVAWERGSGTLSDHFVLNGGAGHRERQKIMGFVGIQTGFASAGRRRSLRKTWFPSDRQGLLRLEESTGLAFRFVIGKTKDKKKTAELKREVKVYDDFLLLDIEEEYSKLPYKTLAFFKAAYALFDADFYVKADDDIYLRPDRLSLLLAKERPNPQTYLGCMKKGPVFTDPKLKWYEPLSHLLGSEYFLHAYGPIYALSTEVVASLISLRNDSFRMFSNEDVTLGAWMLAMNVNHEDNRALCSPNCTPSSIAVWDIPKCSGLCNPEQMMLELHRKETCSAGPTSASD
ncbi:probable beta-1,3-galactosyltransferase 14 [Phalaenopsis equestris]|uniref:probable beta-1,3-galactosyltransferase 14 n=1 Tax=Phalaenopsis equestris TaxID=78828 RepID=UPI0009E512C0|nr:probable beta-1,3-galactosyltransferase 14 [Phalaenopsis equestris]